VGYRVDSVASRSSSLDHQANEWRRSPNGAERERRGPATASENKPARAPTALMLLVHRSRVVIKMPMARSREFTGGFGPFDRDHVDGIWTAVH
jgi:hypothetical protein